MPTEQTEKFRALLCEVIADGCLTHNDMRDSVCFYCDGQIESRFRNSDSIKHAPDCLYIRIAAELNNTQGVTL